MNRNSMILISTALGMLLLYFAYNFYYIAFPLLVLGTGFWMIAKLIYHVAEELIRNHSARIRDGIKK